jgi:hypothetical protein
LETSPACEREGKNKSTHVCCRIRVDECVLVDCRDEAAKNSTTIDDERPPKCPETSLLQRPTSHHEKHEKRHPFSDIASPAHAFVVNIRRRLSSTKCFIKNSLDKRHTLTFVFQPINIFFLAVSHSDWARFNRSFYFLSQSACRIRPYIVQTICYDGVQVKMKM